MLKKENKYLIYDVPRTSRLKEFVKCIIGMAESAYYNALYTVIHPREYDHPKYNVSVCAIFKNEARYLREWVEFNHLVGVDHFYLYNNNSTDNYLEVITPYIESGLVTLVQWPHDQKQMEAYMDGIKRFSSETKWLGFIDIDEFIVPRSTNSIYELLRQFEDRGSVKVYWRLYGSAGRIHRDTHGLVCEDFTVCWPKYCDIGKCFYNTAFDFDFNSSRTSSLHHHCLTSYRGINLPPVNIFNKICVRDINSVKSNDFPIQINHYFTKSYDEYIEKCSKGDVYFEENPHNLDYFYEHEMKCTGTDFSAYKYLVQLKLRMADR